MADASGRLPRLLLCGDRGALQGGRQPDNKEHKFIQPSTQCEGAARRFHATKSRGILLQDHAPLGCREPRGGHGITIVLRQERVQTQTGYEPLVAPLPSSSPPRREAVPIPTRPRRRLHSDPRLRPRDAASRTSQLLRRKQLHRI